MPRRTTGSRIETIDATPESPHTSASRQPASGSARSRRAVGYLRRSTDRQEQSIGDQRKAVERYASEQGLTLLRCYVDDAISGTSTMGRKAFQAMVQDSMSSACDFGTVIVYDVKRFGRVDNDEAGYYRHIFRQHGVEIRYASEGFAGDASDDLLRPVKQWQARQESKDLAKVAIRGLVSKALAATSKPASKATQRGLKATSKHAATADPARGAWMGGAPPFGYDLKYESQAGEFLLVLRYERDGSKRALDPGGKEVRRLGRDESLAVSKRDRAKLIPGAEERVRAVKTIFRLYVEERRGIKAIADELNRRKVETARAPTWSSTYSGLWAAATVRAILVNPAYRGDLAWNRRTDARFFRITGDGTAVERTGARARRLEANDPKDWIEARDTHPAIVTRRVWELAQQIMKEKPSSKGQRGKPKLGQRRDLGAAWVGPKTRFLLAGLCECSGCGSRYEGHGAPTGHAPPGIKRLKAWSYACGGYIRRGRSTCTRGGVQMTELDEAVVGAVLGHYQRFDGDRGRAALERTVLGQVGGERDSIERSRSRLTAQKTKLDALVRNLLDNLTAVNRADVDRRLTELGKQRELVERDLRSLDHVAIDRAEVEELLKEVWGFLTSLPTTLKDGRAEERRSALQRCVERVVIDREKKAAVVMVRSVPAVSGGPRSGVVEAVSVKLASLSR